MVLANQHATGVATLQVITFASQKGGSGKSTLAAHLSVHADTSDKPALLIDADPQGSLAFWHEIREIETPVLAKCEASEIEETVEAAAKDGIEWVFVDTPPHNAPAIADAMRAATLVIIPLRPAVFDLAAVAKTLEMAKALSKPVLPVINSAPARRGIARAPVVNEARDALIAMGARPFAGQITQRAAFAHALASGQAVGEFEPDSLAAREMRDLWQEVLRALGMKG